MQLTYPERDPKARIVQEPEPDNRRSWPKVPSRFIFIFEAINEVGAALFAGSWTGRELEAVNWRESPRDERARLRQKVAVPRGAGVQRQNALAPQAPVTPPKYLFAHILDWQTEQRQALWEENGSATTRLVESVEWIAQRCRDGELQSFARPIEGGQVHPMRDHEWNVDVPLFEFVMNGGSRRRFYEMGHRNGPFDSYAFLDREKLRELLSHHPDARLVVGEADLSRLSPYLQSAVRLALKKGYTSRDTCDSGPVREAEIRAAWSDLLTDVTMTKNAVEAIARVIGFPDNKAIETGLRAKAEKQRGALKP